MERNKEKIGWTCVLTPEELEYARNELVLRQYIDKWKVQLDNSISLRVYPWSYWLMELFIEGLGEGGFPTVNVFESSKGVEVIEDEY